MRIARTLLLALLLFPAALAAQEHSIYFEALGNGGIYSVNYERPLRPQLLGRVGISALTWEAWFGDNVERVAAVPLTLTYVTGSPRHAFEVGGGILVGYKTESEDRGDGAFASWTGVAGYRFVNDGGFLFRIGLTPFVPITRDDKAYPDEDPIVSLGFSFGKTWR